VTGMLGIEHIGVMARDPVELAAWYQSALGFEIAYKTDGSPPTYFLKRGSTTLLEIFPQWEGYNMPPSEVRKTTHICFEVSDLERAIQELEENGVPMTSAPIEVFLDGRIVFLQDPEGNLLQLIYRPVKPWATTG